MKGYSYVVSMSFVEVGMAGWLSFELRKANEQNGEKL